MRRRLFTLAIFLLLGVVTRVAVAYLLVWHHPDRKISAWVSLTDQDVRWVHHLQRQPRSDEVHTQQGLGWSSREVFLDYEIRPDFRLMRGTFVFPSALHIKTGWPMRILAVDGWDHTGPWRILWPGLALNTLFHAAVLWLPIRGPFTLRRHIRRKRGLCVACGYDLGHADHEACPECGAAPRDGRASPGG